LQSLTANFRTLHAQAFQAQILKMLDHAEEVFGATEIAEKWLQEPNLATDGLAPLALLDSDSGYARVKTLLDRIDYGVLS
jgi:uncharacterized protein (DUF2384 family)